MIYHRKRWHIRRFKFNVDLTIPAEGLPIPAGWEPMYVRPFGGSIIVYAKKLK